MIPSGQDSLNTRSTLEAGGKTYAYYSLPKAAEALGDISRLPFSMKVLLENLLRFEDGRTVTRDDLQAMVDWQKERRIAREIQYRPARVLMQDFTGVPAVVDLAAMRDAMSELGGDPQKINPLVPVHLIIDHSVMVDEFGTPRAFGKNVELEYQRNGERYEFLKWGSQAFDNFQVVPPGTGICHQVNLEYIAQCVWTGEDQSGETLAYPDTLVGTDSHTTMVNGLGVLGWGVGGIEAEAAMLGQPISMLIPEVVGFRLSGELREGITATDLVLTVTQMLRQKGVVGRFVEFYGPGLDSMTLADRATIANMAPEYGATCGFFPVDQRTLDYLELTGREADRIALVKAYAQAQGLWRDAVDARAVVHRHARARHGDDRAVARRAQAAAGPRAAERGRRPVQRRARATPTSKHKRPARAGRGRGFRPRQRRRGDRRDHQLHQHLQPVGAGRRRPRRPQGARQGPAAASRGSRPASRRAARWSPIISTQAGSAKISTRSASTSSATAARPASAIRGRSPSRSRKAITDNDLVAVSVLSGNRNFEGRVSPDCRANYLASPPLVVAYALKGTVRSDIVHEPIGTAHATASRCS